MPGCLACSNLGLTSAIILKSASIICQSRQILLKPANVCLLIKAGECEFAEAGRYDMLGYVPSFQIEWPFKCWNMFPSATRNNVCQLLCLDWRAPSIKLGCLGKPILVMTLWISSNIVAPRYQLLKSCNDPGFYGTNARCTCSRIRYFRHK